MADDDHDDFYLFSTILREENNSVKFTWCKSGSDLLKFLTEGNDPPDLILLDMNMPGYDGQKCLKIIKEELLLLHIPVIIFSTSSSPSAIKLACEQGAFRYIVKPHSIEALREIIKGMLSMLEA
jgi:CheY-like chemotaxis protein